MDLNLIAKELKTYKGLRRKNIISRVLKYFSGGENCNTYIDKNFRIFDDSAVINYRKGIILFTTDGIIEDLVNRNPFWAGYSSILVNVNDIVAMGGYPIAAVNVIAMKNISTGMKIVRGLKEGAKKFAIRIVGGHTHPNASYNAISTAMLGVGNKKTLLRSDTASADEDIILAVDLNGKFTKGIPYSWDTTSFRETSEIKRRIDVVLKIANERLATACKDISNPGILGTLGMLLESSKKGAIVELHRIPTPKKIDFLQWLKAYQGFGFIFTSNPKTSEKIINYLRPVGITANKIGSITNDKKLIIKNGNDKKVLFNFEKEFIAGL